MKLITELRSDIRFPDNLAEFGTLLKFAAFVYDDQDDVETQGFASYNMDGDVAFYDSREKAEEAFELAKSNLTSIEQTSLDPVFDDEEAMVGLFETPKGFMVLAATTVMGYESGLESTDHTNYHEAMPHVTWDRILSDMF